MTSTDSQSISLPPTSPSTSSISPFSHQEVDEKPTTSAAQPSLNQPEHGGHAVSSPAPTSTVSISGSNASFTDQGSESGSSPPYLHSPPGSPSVSPFRRPLRVDRHVPFKVDDSPISTGGLQVESAERRAETAESIVAPAISKKTKAQLWNEIKLKCMLTSMGSG